MSRIGHYYLKRKSYLDKIKTDNNSALKNRMIDILSNEYIESIESEFDSSSDRKRYLSEEEFIKENTKEK